MRQVDSTSSGRASSWIRPSAVLTASLAGLVLVGGWILLGGDLEKDAGNYAPEVSGWHEWAGFEADLFYRGVLEAEEKEPAADDARLKAVIVPHHYLASHLTAEVFGRLAKNPPPTIYVFGPDHEEALPCTVGTSDYGWRTAEGDVRPDLDVVDSLVSSGRACSAEEVLEKDHSVAGMMPFIARYLPGAKVVPLLVKRNAEMSDIREIVGQIDKQDIVLASVDFSHYLTVPEAEKMDDETLRALERRDWDSLWRFGSDHLDSPASVFAAFEAAGTVGQDDFEILGHENSGRLMGETMTETTSYFTVVFYSPSD